MDMQRIKMRLAYIRDFWIGMALLLIGWLLPVRRPDRRDLGGKVAVVTGGNSGVGYQMALQLAEMGASVYIACRNADKAAAAVAEMTKELSTTAVVKGGNVRAMSLDNLSFASVRAFADAYVRQVGRPLDMLLLNAGIIEGPPPGPDGQPVPTKDGFESVYQANFLSSFLLVRLLRDHLAPDARIVFTSSSGSYGGSISDDFALTRTLGGAIEVGYHINSKGVDSKAVDRYYQSKLMQAACTRALQAHFDDMQRKTEKKNDARSGRLVFCFQPGIVRTNIFSTWSAMPDFRADPQAWILEAMWRPLGITPRQGAYTGVHLAVSDAPAVVKNRGRYFDRRKVRTNHPDFYSQEKLDKLWIRWCADADVTWT